MQKESHNPYIYLVLIALMTQLESLIVQKH